MQRDLKHMASTQYDLLIIGGGITGACIAWDAALRGLKVALVEKKDFGHATSSATSKLIHGGLRYIKNMEFSLVRESLRERRTLEAIAPHLVHPLPFVVPTYGWGMRGKLVLMAGLFLYDLLAYDRKRLDDQDKRIPGFKLLGRKNTLQLGPGIRKEQLTGGAVYYDCQMASPDRLTLEFIQSADEFGADVANYAEVREFIKEGQTVQGAVVADRLSGELYPLKAKLTVNSAGPWADLLLGLIEGDQSKSLIRSKGIHLITRPLVKDHAVVLYTPAGRHFFIIPWRGHSLIGTTDTLYEGSPDDFHVTEQDIESFLNDINQGYPEAKLTRADVLHFYGGMRPIVDDQAEAIAEVYSASRRYEICDHEKESGLKGLLTIVGGKYTTSRNLAEHVVDQIFHKLQAPPVACQTQNMPLFGGDISRFAGFLKRQNRRNPNLPKHVVENLCRQYGTQVREVLALCQQDPALTELIHPNYPDIKAQVIHAVRQEMACSLSDVLFRRTGLGTLGDPGEATVRMVAEMMAAELGWSSEQVDEQIHQVYLGYKPAPVQT